MKSIFRVSVFVVLVLVAVFAKAQTGAIRINQLGYYPTANKMAVVVFTNASTFEVVDTASDAVVFSGDISEKQYWSDAGDSVSICDFSDLTTSGIYKIRIPDFGESYSFEISPTVMRQAAYASLKSFYYSRCSYDLDSVHAGLWERKGGHWDTAVTFHASSGNTGSLSSPGGWYDAGDFGKYVVNAGISVGNLLSFYENFKGVFGDSIMNIPESGNGKSDLLDEVKIELDWLKTMQDDDGGVFFKLTTLNFDAYIMPEDATAERFVIGKSTSSALDFAAMMAMAGRIYVDYDADFAADCKTRAADAWEWAKANPTIYYSNPSDVSTGEYGDSDVSDEFIWAAAELFITTGDAEYKTYLEEHVNSLGYRGAPSWGAVGSLATLSLALQTNGLHDTITEDIRNSIVEITDDWLDEIASNASRIPDFTYNWGSNNTMANKGIGLLYAYLITDDIKYAKGAGECLDYIFGKNGTGYSFMTSYGKNTPMHIHHRVTYADDIVQPVPGYVAGGPNSGRQDGKQYPFHKPAKSYIDYDSYASNEIAINWGAPLTALLGGVDAIFGDSSLVDFSLATTLNDPPVMNLVLPKFDAEYDEGDELTVDGRASDADGIERIELYIDSRFIEESDENTLRRTFDGLSVGKHTVTMVAFDTKGLARETSNSFNYVALSNADVVLEMNEELKLTVVPNPVVDNFSVIYNQSELTQTEFVLYDMNGCVIDRVVDKETLIGERVFSWELKHELQPGMYNVFMLQNNVAVSNTQMIKIK